MWIFGKLKLYPSSFPAKNRIFVNDESDSKHKYLDRCLSLKRTIDFTHVSMTYVYRMCIGQFSIYKYQHSVHGFCFTVDTACSGLLTILSLQVQNGPHITIFCQVVSM